MALLTYSSPVVGTSSDFTFQVANYTLRSSISTASTTTTTTTTTLTNKTTTTTTTTTSTTTSSYILSHLRPLLSTTLKTLYQTHALLFSTFILLLLLRFFSLLHSLLHSLLQLLALSTSLATKLLVYRTLLLVKNITMETASLTYSIWDSHKARQIRKKIEFEFFVWILGPGGNLLCFLLWPGWIVLGVMIWGVSCLMTGLLSGAAGMGVPVSSG